MLAHLSHYLHNNQIPSGDEDRQVKAFRAIPLGQISLMDVEIERVGSTLNSLKQKRANVQKFIDDCNTILAPVRRLPVDILKVIFEYCLATHRHPIMSPSEAPILLTQICHDWRSVALSTPLLWSRLYIPLLKKISPAYWYDAPPSAVVVERTELGCLEQVKRWIRLSGGCPLSISIKITSPGTLHINRTLLDSIIKSSRRLQHLELDNLASQPDLYTSILGMSADDLCMLQEIRLLSTAWPEHVKDLWHQSGLFTTQSLRRVSIADMHNEFPAGLPPNWKNLTHLFIHSSIFLGSAGKVLSHCHNLVACLLQVSTPWRSTHANFPPEYSFLPHLKFLSLRGEHIACNRLYSKIDAPSLRHLDCQGDPPNENGELGIFNLLRNITNNSLETLMIEYRSLTPENALRCYALAPSLKRLVLGQSPTERYASSIMGYDTYPEQITPLYNIRRFPPNPRPTVLLPLLEVFEAYGIQNTSDYVLLEFITVRITVAKAPTTGVSMLRKVVVHFGRTREIDIVPDALAYAHKSGIELELELKYDLDRDSEVYKNWSPSYGLSDQDTSWHYPDFTPQFYE